MNVFIFAEDESGKDMLYVVIDRIIETHNDMIKSFYSVHVKRLHCILPEKPAEISPREVKLDDAIPGCMLTEYVEHEHVIPYKSVHFCVHRRLH